MKGGRATPRDGPQGASTSACVRSGLPAGTELHENALPATPGAGSSGLQRGYDPRQVCGDDSGMLGAAGGAMEDDMADMADAAGGMAAFDLQSIGFGTERALQDHPVRTL
jgi:hypothetical protein